MSLQAGGGTFSRATALRATDRCWRDGIENALHSCVRGPACGTASLRHLEHPMPATNSD
jgi:hypothetical protein